MVTEQLGRDSPLETGCNTLSQSTSYSREMGDISAATLTLPSKRSQSVGEIFTDVLSSFLTSHFHLSILWFIFGRVRARGLAVLTSRT